MTGPRDIVRDLYRRTFRWSLAGIRSRADLPYVLNALGLVAEGVEVGIEAGGFSAHILSSWKGRKLYSIDPWIETDGGDVYESATQETHESNYRQAQRRLGEFGSRSEIIRSDSISASARFSVAQLDFVYIDALHHREAVEMDIEAWYPKIKPGGIIGGHDYLDGELPGGRFDVKSVVDEFSKTHGLRVFVSRERSWRSWFLVRPQSRLSK